MEIHLITLHKDPRGPVSIEGRLPPSKGLIFASPENPCEVVHYDSHRILSVSPQSPVRLDAKPFAFKPIGTVTESLVSFARCVPFLMKRLDHVRKRIGVCSELLETQESPGWAQKPVCRGGGGLP